MVVGIPILNRPDLLRRCLASFPARVRILLVDNSVAPDDTADIAAIARKFNATRLRQKRNIGVAASWNLILRTIFASSAESALIGSNDIRLAPGDLQRGLQFARRDNPGGITHLLGWNLYLMPKAVYQEVGAFDENFHPAYLEDTDYSRRCLCAGIRRVNAPGIAGEHVGSATVRSNRKYGYRCRFTHHQSNRLYYHRKWGGGPGTEIFTQPFDREGADQRWWPPAGERIRRNDWDRADFFPFIAGT